MEISQTRVNNGSPRSALLIYSSYNHCLHPLQNQSLPSFKLTTTLTNSLTLKQSSWNHRLHSSQPYQVIPFLSSSFVPPFLAHVALIHSGPNCCYVDHARLLPSPLFFSPTILLLLLFFFSLSLLGTCCLLFLSKLSSFFLLLCLTLFSFTSTRRLATVSRCSCSNRSFSYVITMLEISVAAK